MSAPHRPSVSHSTHSDLVATLDRAVASLGVRAKLSNRERTVLRFMAMGYRYPDIGRVLRISPRTVKMHATNLRAKTGTDSRLTLLGVLFGSSAP